MRVLVTGVTGFTGGHLARALAARGHEVRALVRSASRVGELSSSGYDIVVGDLRDAKAVDRAVVGIEQVYHLAAAYREAGRPDRHYHDVNVEGTRNILAAARRHQVQRVVHCSTVGVHGDVGSGSVDETGPLKPADIYQRTKLEAERLAAGAFASGLPGVIFRPAAIYGPGDTRLLKLFRGLQRGQFVILGSGGVHYHLVYIDDLVDGILLCGSAARALGEVYILAGRRSVTLNELVRLVCAALDVSPPRLHLPLWPVMALAHVCQAICKPLRLSPPLFPRRLDFFRKHRSFKIDKAGRELGYAPQVGLEEGIRRTIDWYVEQGLLSPPVLPSPAAVEREK